MWKEALLVGRQRDARGNWFTISPRDVQDAHANVQKMRRRGVPVPAVWEHVNVEAGDPDEWKARYAKYTFGHVTDSRINDRGALELFHDVPDPKDREQLLKTKFCSPKIYRGYSDSRGGEYHGTTISHNSATPSPLQYWQQPWQLSRDDALFLSYVPPNPKGASMPTATKNNTGLSGLIDALQSVGINVPDEVNDIPGLIIAIKASGGANGGGNDGNDDDEVPGTGHQPMQLSTTRRGTARNRQQQVAIDFLCEHLPPRRARS